MKRTAAKVAIVMGSDSDLPVMQEAARALKQFRVGFEMRVVSAHRTPREVAQFAETARERGFRVIIAGAGGAAHLPGMIAAATELPVIGVPVPSKALSGLDSLLSIVQMPKGIPVATVGIGNAWNAGLLAVQLMGAEGGNGSEVALDRLRTYKNRMRKTVLRIPMNRSLLKEISKNK